MPKLYDFPKSSASYRARIGCNLKGVDYERVLIDFRKNDQRSVEYLQVNPSGLLPAYEDETGRVLSQSLSILKYLDLKYDQPRFFPQDQDLEIIVWELALIIACDIHPLNNLRVLNYLQERLHVDEAQKNEWYAHWIKLGFEGLEARLNKFDGPYCCGDTLTAVDICLVPQVFNARRFDVPLDGYPKIVAIDAYLKKIPAFEMAAPR